MRAWTSWPWLVAVAGCLLWGLAVFVLVNGLGALFGPPGVVDVAFFTAMGLPVGQVMAKWAIARQRGETSMTWTQPVCDERWEEMYPGRHPYRIRLEEGDEPDRCCYCNRPANIYVRLDPTTVPHPRSDP